MKALRAQYLNAKGTKKKKRVKAERDDIRKGHQLSILSCCTSGTSHACSPLKDCNIKRLSETEWEH